MRLVLAAALLSGCSLLVVRGPETTKTPGDCTESATTPIAVDIAIAVALAAASTVLIDDRDQGGRTEHLAIGLGAIPLAALAVVSAAVGYRRSQDCTDAKGSV